MARVQDLLDHVDDALVRDVADDDLDLDLGQQARVDLDAAVHLAGALLQAVARDLAHGHAGDTGLVEGDLELVELARLAADHDVVHAAVGEGLDHGDGRVDLGLRRLLDIVLAQVAALVGAHELEVRVGRVADGKAGVGGGQAVLGVVEAVDLDLLRHAQADELVDDLEDHEHRGQDPRRHGDESERLDAQLGHAAAIEEAAVGGKEANAERAEGAAAAVDRDGADGVVDLYDLVEELDRQDHDDARDDARDGGAERVHDVAAGGDGDEAGERGVERQRDVGLAVAAPGEDHRGEGGHRRGEVGVEADEAGVGHLVVAGHADGGAAVEAEPAEPQDKDAEGHGGHAVAEDGARLAVLAVLADARPQERGAEAGRHAADEVDRSRAGEVMEAELREPAAAPDPVTRDRVDDQADHRRVEHVGLEVRALGHRAGNDGGGRRAEHGLEQRVDPGGQRAEVVATLDERVEAADEGARAAEHDAEAEDPEYRGADAEVHEVLHQDVAGVLRAGKTGLAQREASLHEIDEERPDERPGHVCRAEHISLLYGPVSLQRSALRRTRSPSDEQKQPLTSLLDLARQKQLDRASTLFERSKTIRNRRNQLVSFAK